ncbi:hypothetical protein WH266_08060 [Pseudomonas sp. MYb330]|uniref:Uncharacterized protein n=1 Tax=Pseudomonas sp. MYb327 TaxID=2745230 RepID=A0AAU8E984_9PSED
MSTLSEIAANHARMVMAKAEASTEPRERHLHIVASFEVTSPDDRQHIPLHFIVGAQDSLSGPSIGHSL